jgi:hypothetical protein
MSQVQGRDRVDFYGTIETGDREVAAGVLRRWLIVCGLSGMVETSGDVLTYAGAGTYVSCHKADTGPGTPPYFLLEGRLTTTLDGAGLRLGTLVPLCQAAGLGWDLDYVQVGEDGRELGEELTVTADTARTMSTRDRSPSLPRMFET